MENLTAEEREIIKAGCLINFNKHQASSKPRATSAAAARLASPEPNGDYRLGSATVYRSGHRGCCIPTCGCEVSVVQRDLVLSSTVPVFPANDV